MKYFLITLVISIFLVFLAPSKTVFAQDAVKVDPKHYKVEFENDQVRVLRINYGPHEKSVMHQHPDSIAIAMNDMTLRFTTPDGKTQDVTYKAGQSMWAPAGTHLPENTGDKPMEVVLVELKPKTTM